MALARFSQSDRFLYEVVSAGAAHFFNIPSLDGEEAARIRPVLIDTAGAGAVGMLFEKRALEEQLTARAAAIAFAPSQGQCGNHILFAKIDVNQAAQLSLCLAGAKLRILQGARAQPLFQALFERTLARSKSAKVCAHQVCWKEILLKLELRNVVSQTDFD
jgi:hypothetical protein